MKKIFALFLFLMAASGAFAQEYIKIMSYNVRNAKGMDNVRDYSRVAKVILEAAPDVVAVQELDSMTSRSGRNHVLGEIAKLVNMHAEYFPAISFDGGKYGIGILSKEQPLEVKGYPLPGRRRRELFLLLSSKITCLPVPTFP